MSIPLPVLKDARALAEHMGAVVNGHHWFEDQAGRELDVEDVIHDPDTRDKVCRVCITGAVLLASLNQGDPVRWGSIPHHAGEAAVRVLQGLPRTRVADASRCLTDKVTELGTSYVVAVLGEMVDQARITEEHGS